MSPSRRTSPPLPPSPGSVYRVRKGDSFSAIAAIAYGDPRKADRIRRANPSVLSLTPGTPLTLPRFPEEEALSTRSTPAKQKRLDELVLSVGSRRLYPSSLRVVLTADTLCDGWSASIPYEPGEDSTLDKLLAPYAYPDASVSLSGNRIITGRLYSTTRSLGRSGRSLSMGGFSYTADLLDSHPLPPYEHKNITLMALAKNVIEPVGVGVLYEAKANPVFPAITVDSRKTIGAFFETLAAQHNIQATCSPHGEARFCSPTPRSPVAALEETFPPGLEQEITFDGRKKFHTYRVVAQNSEGASAEATVVDENVPIGRHTTIDGGTLAAEELPKAAASKRSSATRQVLSIPFPVTGWRPSPQSQQWQPYDTVTLRAPTLGIEKPFLLTITTVEFLQEVDKQTTLLHLVPPGALTGEPIKEPWHA